MNRRQALSGIAGGLAATVAPRATRPARASANTGFPADFQWGCATAAYQIEGSVATDGRGPTNWDVFAHTLGKIAGGDDADVACDSYRRHAEDTRLLADLGASSYRMSIAWSRIFPEGRGKPNTRGIDHYNRVVDGLLEAGIQPHITLFHWDLPLALAGGWQNRDTAKAFADYAGFVTARLSDRVSHFMTLNELRAFTDLGHLQGSHAPGLRLSQAEANQVRHHGLLAHGLGVQAIRASARTGTKVGLADNTYFFVPVIETAPHVQAAKKATREMNAMFLTAIMEGGYLDSYLDEQGAAAPRTMAGDMAAIGSPLDFVSLNIYDPEWVRADESRKGYAVIPHSRSSPRMASPWLVVGPEVAYWGVRLTAELWSPRQIFISENGASADDPLIGGRIDDADRIMFLRNYLGQFRRAIDEGFPLKGYFVWSLLDTFEWANGFGKKFGLYHVDRATQRRTPKLSAEWYKEVIRQNRLV